MKKLTCSTNLCNIIGKPYEKNIINLILLTCEDAAELNVGQIEYNFYYNGTTTDKQIRHFLEHFKGFPHVRVQPLRDYSVKNTWFNILTKEEYRNNETYRTYFILKEVSEQSLTQAFMEYYSKAKLQVKLSKNGK